MDHATGRGVLDAQKQDLLSTFYKVAWEEMTWRRNAGYRTIILGLAYCTLLLAMVAFNKQMPQMIKISLAAVLVVGTLFGSVYLMSNYRKYMIAAKRLVRIEEHVGAFNPDFLAQFGALMPPERRAWPDRPITRDMVCLWSVIAFAAGGLITATAIAML